MYKYTRGLREWTLDMDSFSKDFLNKCKIFNINSTNMDANPFLLFQN